MIKNIKKLKYNQVIVYSNTIGLVLTIISIGLLVMGNLNNFLIITLVIGLVLISLQKREEKPKKEDSEEEKEDDTK